MEGMGGMGGERDKKTTEGESERGSKKANREREREMTSRYEGDKLTAVIFSQQWQRHVEIK